MLLCFLVHLPFSDVGELFRGNVFFEIGDLS